MSSHPPWTPPEAATPDAAVPGSPLPDAPPPPPPPGWPPGAVAPPFGPPPHRPAGPRSAVVAVVLVVLIAVLGIAGVVLVGTRGGSGDDGSATRSDEDQGGPPALAPPKVVDGYTLFADADGSFAMVVPDGWITVLLDRESVRRARDRLEDENPQVATALATIDRLAAGRGLGFAAERHDADGFVANLNLLLSQRSNETLAEVAAAGRSQLEAQGFHVGAPRALKVGDRDGIVVDVDLSAPTGTVHEQQLYLASGYRVYVLTLAGTDPSAAETIMRSLRVP